MFIDARVGHKNKDLEFHDIHTNFLERKYFEVRFWLEGEVVILHSRCFAMKIFMLPIKDAQSTFQQNVLIKKGEQD